MSVKLDSLLEALADELSARIRPTVGYVTREKLAADIGCTVRTIRTWREKGCPGVREGKEILYDPTAVRRWLERTR